MNLVPLPLSQGAHAYIPMASYCFISSLPFPSLAIECNQLFNQYSSDFTMWQSSTHFIIFIVLNVQCPH
jgi:hypothetical protein